MPHSLAKFHFHAFANLLLNLLILGVAGYLLVTDLRESINQERAAETAQRLANDVRGLLRIQQSTVERLSKRPEVINALRQGNLRDQQRQAEELRTQLPQAKAVWLLPASNVTERQFPPLLDEACRDLVRRAAAGTADVPIESHAAHTPAEHYDVLKPVLDENKRPLGYLLLSLHAPRCKRWLSARCRHRPTWNCVNRPPETVKWRSDMAAVRRLGWTLRSTLRLTRYLGR